jgi:GT2 family glycosyltransferase
MLPDTTAAVIVTYNRLFLLQQCIAALRAQTQALTIIIVINNSSTDGTEEWLKQQPDIVTITQENRGGAFGFYTGIKTAFEKGYEWIWCMDDDGIPDKGAMASLMQHRQRRPCVMNALVLDKDAPEKIVFQTGPYTLRSQIKEEVIEGAANFFNGTLFHYGVIEKAGLPLRQLTIWGDETEYFNRIKFRFRFPVFTVASSLHFHPAAFSRFYVRNWDLAGSWKTYFYIRNKRFVLGSQHASSIRSLFSYSAFLVAFLGTIVVYQKTDKWKKAKLLWRAGVDGLKKDTSKSIPAVRQLLQQL